MTKQLILKVPEGTDADDRLNTLLVALMGICREYDLGFSVDVGECISPIAVRGDLDLETAEGIKQRALAHVRAWEARGTK